MPLLDRLLEQRIRLVDFETIRDKTGSQRLVAFGRYAGIAGAFDFLRGCGEFMLEKGYQTPFIHLGSAYMYEDFSAMKEALDKIAGQINKRGLPKNHTPMVFAVTGTGRVAQGILDVLELLPHQKIDPDDLRFYFESGLVENKKIIIS